MQETCDQHPGRHREHCRVHAPRPSARGGEADVELSHVQASIIALRNAQDSNKVLVALAEQQVIEAKRQRDAEARAINNHIRFLAEERELLAAQKANASQAMMSFRMP